MKKPIISFMVLVLLAVLFFAIRLGGQKSDVTLEKAKLTAVTLEAGGNIKHAYKKLKEKGRVSQKTNLNDLLPYLNYLSINTTKKFDSLIDCSKASIKCIQLHNGAIIVFDTNNKFDGDSEKNAIHFLVIPSEKKLNEAIVASSPISLFLYYDGEVSSELEYDAHVNQEFLPISPYPDWVNLNKNEPLKFSDRT